MQQPDIAEVHFLIVSFLLHVAAYEQLHCTAAWS